MVVAIDQRTQKILVLIKQTYTRAHDDSVSKYRYLSRIQAVIGFAWANETALKATIRALDHQASLDRDLNGLIQQCDNLMTKDNYGELANRKELLYVQRIRNQAQHEARHPTLEELQDCRTYTRDFLSVFIRQIWGVAWDEISMAEAIEHTEVKKYIKASEACLESGDYDNAVNYATIGFRWAFESVEDAIFPSDTITPLFRPRFRSLREDNYELRSLSGELENLFEDFVRWVNKGKGNITELSTVATFGIDLEMYVRFRSLAPNVSFAETGTPWIDRKYYKYLDEKASFVVQFCTDSILQLESVIGDLSAPFGIATIGKLKFMDLKDKDNN